METTNQDKAQTALQNTASKVTDLANKIDDTIKKSQDKLTELQGALVDKTKYAAETTDAYVQENPWKAVACAAGFGLIVGLLMGRR